MGLSDAEHKALGIELFNATWELIDLGDKRSPDDDAEMLRRAYASAYHWSHVARPLERQRSEWLLARVWTLLGDGAPALRHARRAAEIGEAARWDPAADFAEFDLPFALEALARASAAAGAIDDARIHRARAEAAGSAITEAEEREYFLADLAGGPWFGLDV